VREGEVLERHVGDQFVGHNLDAAFVERIARNVEELKVFCLIKESRNPGARVVGYAVFAD